MYLTSIVTSKQQQDIVHHNHPSKPVKQQMYHIRYREWVWLSKGCFVTTSFVFCKRFYPDITWHRYNNRKPCSPESFLCKQHCHRMLHRCLGKSLGNILTPMLYVFTILRWPFHNSYNEFNRTEWLVCSKCTKEHWTKCWVI